MSGIKDSYVKLKQPDQDRLMQSCERIDDVDASIAERLSEAAQRFREFIERHLPQLSSTEASQAAIMPSHSGSTPSSLTDAEQAQSQATQQLSQQFQQQLSRLLDAPNEQQAPLLREHCEQLNEALKQQQQRFQQHTRALYQSQLERRQDEKSLASQWLARLRELLEPLSEHEALDLMPAGVLTPFDETLQQCDQYYQRGYYQAALAASHECYLQAQQLRLEFEATRLTQAAWLNLAQYRLAAAKATAEVQKQAQFRFSVGGAETIITADIDYWTDGHLSHLQQQLNTLEQQLNVPNRLNTAQLQHLVIQIEQQRAQLMALSADAQTALIASQLRHNIGQTIEHSLANAGWEVVDATYEQQDFRRAMHIKLRNFQGDEMVTIIQPAQAVTPLDSRLNIAFFELTADERTRQARLQQMVQALQQQGLEVSTPRCRAGTEQQSSGERELLDFEQLRPAPQHR